MAWSQICNAFCRPTCSRHVEARLFQQRLVGEQRRLGHVQLLLQGSESGVCGREGRIGGVPRLQDRRQPRRLEEETTSRKMLLDARSMMLLVPQHSLLDERHVAGIEFCRTEQASI